MKYDFKCGGCGALEEYDIPLKEFPDHKESGVECRECGATAEYVFNPQSVQISFVGDAWADKNYQEKAYRNRRSKYLKKRQYEVHKKPELVPNFKGEEADTWEEAADAARDEGLSTESYEPLIQKERLDNK